MTTPQAEKKKEKYLSFNGKIHDDWFDADFSISVNALPLSRPIRFTMVDGRWGFEQIKWYQFWKLL